MMSITWTKRTLYFAIWDEKVYSFGSSYNHAMSALKRSYAYGDPVYDAPFALGTEFAEEGSSMGWMIIPREYDCPVLRVKVVGKVGTTRHILWECPFCRAGWSDDYHDEELARVILSCGCMESKSNPYYIIDSAAAKFVDNCD